MLYYHVDDPMIKAEENHTRRVKQRLLRELRMTGLVNEDDTIVRLLDGEFVDKSDTVPLKGKGR